MTTTSTRNLLDIGSEIKIDENDMHVSNGWKEGRQAVELDVMAREMYCRVPTK